MDQDTIYRGRFAPSPSGPLHMGSLLSALGSYLDARAHGGLWLVRIEDIDPPRETPGADLLILQSLADHGLHWDGEPLYQHTRSGAYDEAIERLLESGQAFYCTCSRQEQQAARGEHAAACPRSRLRPALPASIRVQAPQHPLAIPELFGNTNPSATETGAADFVVRRKDELYAYQLAVVVDDAGQEISHVIRGRDLLETTPMQQHLQALLGLPTPRYGHLPLLLDPGGEKLSKQTHATAIDNTRAPDNLLYCLQALGQPAVPPPLRKHCAAILDFATRHWVRARVPATDTTFDSAAFAATTPAMAKKRHAE